MLLFTPNLKRNHFFLLRSLNYKHWHFPIRHHSPNVLPKKLIDGGRAIFASGSQFAPVEYNGTSYASGQQENLDKGLIYPPLANIGNISAQIAAKVAAKAYELGLATRLPRPENLVAYAESFMYGPSYRKFR